MIARITGGSNAVSNDLVSPLMATPQTPYSAAEQGLGYIYQARLALLHAFSLPESSVILLEKEDDLVFVDEGGAKSLASLKHKSAGDALTNLSIDFWKSVRVWLAHYKGDGTVSSEARYLLFTTATISPTSFLANFVEDVSNFEARVKGADRGGSVSLNSFRGLDKWISASVMLQPGLVAAG